MPEQELSGRAASLDKYNNSEKRREAERRYRERHRERLRERGRKWNEENAERRREIAQASYSRNKEHRLELSRNWYEENKGRKLATSKAWWDKARESGKATEYVVRRRAKQHLKPYSKVIAGAKARAKKAGLEFDLTNEWASEVSDGRCCLSGIPFVAATGKPSPFSPSIDRIDQKRGYTKDNCRLVLWAVNRFRGEDTDEVLLHIAEAIAKHATEKREG
jgi:hypothetical protein